MKAKFIGKVKDPNGYSTHLMYEYRGHQYMICDHNNGCSNTLSSQHKWEQERIDRIIEDEAKVKGPAAYEDTADYAMEMFMKSFEEG
mgnify:FL=1